MSSSLANLSSKPWSRKSVSFGSRSTGEPCFVHRDRGALFFLHSSWPFSGETVSTTMSPRRIISGDRTYYVDSGIRFNSCQSQQQPLCTHPSRYTACAAPIRNISWLMWTKCCVSSEWEWMNEHRNDAHASAKRGTYETPVPCIVLRHKGGRESDVVHISGNLEKLQVKFLYFAYVQRTI